jgi:hypothetical protein
LEGYKKEVANGRVLGLVLEEEADPIPYELYRRFCGWAVDDGNIFVWLFTILQWNCMARSINIANIGLHNLKHYADTMVVKFDYTKKDQSGDKCTPKHLYSNPLDPTVDVFSALAVWLSLNAAKYHDDNKDSLFINGTAGNRSASGRYCNQLKTIINKHEAEVAAFIRILHANSHGLRKGSATYSSSGTTNPPPLTSIGARGEWTLNKILQIYFLFSDVGDMYLGRILAGLDPNASTFAILPAHLKNCEDVNHPDVKRAMELMSGPLMTFLSIGFQFSIY